MLYYRYRPMSQLAVKELLYDELYFSYPEELNDPLDGIVNYEFPADFPKWKRLLEFALKDTTVDVSPVAEILTKSSPLSLKKIIQAPDIIFSAFVKGLGRQYFFLVPELVERLKGCILGYTPTDGCSVSFSKTYKNALMWSHYTGKHEGFCLIFRSLEASINQCPSRVKKAVSLDPNTSLSVDENFKINDINYGPKACINAFTLFPRDVYMDDFTNEGRDVYSGSINEMCFTKSACWEYEQEARLFLPANLACLGSKTLLPIDRIFHYDSSQIAGVIFGMRMSQSNKDLVI